MNLEGIFLKFISLFISLILWVAVVGGKKVQVGLKVPLELLLPKNVVVSNNVPTEVNFRIIGPRAYLNLVKKAVKPITLDLTGVKSGSITFKIHKDLIDLPLGLNVIGYSPNVISIDLREKEKH